MDITIKETERIDELNDRGYHIIQDKTGFRFGLDSVLLSSFAIIHEGDRVLDLGTGSGVIPLLLEAKTKGSHFTGLEYQEEVWDMASRSVQLNDKQEKIRILHGDIRQVPTEFPAGCMEVVTSNPPYMTVKEGLISPNPKKAISRTEVCCTLEDVVRAAAHVLRDKGRFYMVHRPGRLGEIIAVLQKYRFSVRNLRLVYPRIGEECNLVLVEGIYGGASEMVVEKPCIVFGEDGQYVPEMTEIYFHEALMEHRKK